MHCACFILSLMTCLVLSYFSTFSHKQHDFCKNVVKHKVRDLFFSINLSGIFPIVTRFEQAVIIKVLSSSCKVPVIIFRI